MRRLSQLLGHSSRQPSDAAMRKAEVEDLSEELLGSSCTIDEDRIFQAAWHVQDAFDGVERAHPTRIIAGTRWSQLMHLNGAPAMHAVRAAFVVLSFFETPWWARGQDATSSALHARFPMSGLPFVLRRRVPP